MRLDSTALTMRANTASGWPTEVQVMIDFAAAENIDLAANCHAGAELFNYPWDTWTVRTPDEQATAERWADQMIFEGFDPDQRRSDT